MPSNHARAKSLLSVSLLAVSHVDALSAPITMLPRVAWGAQPARCTTIQGVLTDNEAAPRMRGGVARVRDGVKLPLDSLRAPQGIQVVDEQPPLPDGGSGDQEDGSGRGEGAALMLAVALLWGSNFPAVKATIEAGLPGSAAAASRFTVAALALLPLLRTPGGKPLPSDLVKGGLECGAWLALGYIAQALALRDLPAGAVAFLASLQVVFVPMLSAALGEGALSARLALAACLSVSGVALLELGGLSDMGDGGAAAAAMPLAATLLALLQPVGFGTSYLRIESLMSRFPTYGLQLSALQLISNAGISIGWLVLDAVRASSADGGAGLGLGMGAAGGATSSTVSAGELGVALGGLDLNAFNQPEVIAGVLYTGLVSTALTVLLQTRALGKLPASDSSVIVATEPLWAAGFASILLGETLESSAQIGGGLILLGCLSNTLFPADLGLGKGTKETKDEEGQSAEGGASSGIDAAQEMRDEEEEEDRCL